MDLTIPGLFCILRVYLKDNTVVFTRQTVNCQYVEKMLDLFFFFRCKAVPCVADVDIYVLCIYRMIIRKGYYLSAFVNFYIISLPAEACQPKKPRQ